jgi:hypothetical protein
MPSTRFRLTPEVHGKIVAGIRSGAFPYIAAEAAGIPAEVYERWLQMGVPRPKAAGSYKRYIQFRFAVMQAQAHARLVAEIAVLKADPACWLQRGPGVFADQEVQRRADQEVQRS